MKKTTNKKWVFSAYTLVESLVVLSIVSFMIALPVLMTNKLKEQIIVNQFLSSFEKQVLATQQAAIVCQRSTSISTDSNKKTIIFSAPSKFGGRLIIPEFLAMQRCATISFTPYTGNNSTLKQYSFYWPSQKKTIAYQFQLGSGRYVKKISG
ncbi:MAG: competence type IV pilus minor pilin ComGD [Enterococcus sp.]